VGLLPEADATRALLSLLLLLVGTALAAYALRHRRWEVLGAVLATAGVVGWSLLSNAYDGPVLAVVVQGNGFHAGDVLSVPAALLVAYLAYSGARR
jgi:hypothetical protein